MFPIIRRVIHTIYNHKQDYVTHEEIVQGLLSDNSGLREVLAAQRARRHETLEQIAGNMVAWFSQRITVKQSLYENEFDREKIRGKWAYRPRSVQQASQTLDDLLRKKLEQDFDRTIRYRYSVEVPVETGYRPDAYGRDDPEIWWTWDNPPPDGVSMQILPRRAIPVFGNAVVLIYHSKP